MNRMGQRTWHVPVSLPKEYGGKMFRQKSAG